MKKHRLISAIAAALLIAPLAACSAGAGYSGAPDAALDMGVAEPMVGGTAAEYDGSASSAGAERSIIRSGDISLEVDDPAEASERVAQVAEGLGGYVESESLSNRSEGMPAGAYLTLRVPADRLDEAFAELGEVGAVLSQSRAASDVTEIHVDLQARVQALEESVERLTELMAGSATTGELIEAETALSQRQQELDGLRAQLNSLEGQVDQATISVSLTTKSAALPGGPENFWEGLVAGWQSIVTAASGALVLLGILLPWLVILGVIALVIVLIVRSRRKARRASRGGPNGAAGDPANAPAPPAGPAPAVAAQAQAPAAPASTEYPYQG